MLRFFGVPSDTSMAVSDSPVNLDLLNSLRSCSHRSLLTDAHVLVLNILVRDCLSHFQRNSPSLSKVLVQCGTSHQTPQRLKVRLTNYSSAEICGNN